MCFLDGLSTLVFRAKVAGGATRQTSSHELGVGSRQLLGTSPVEPPLAHLCSPVSSVPYFRAVIVLFEWSGGDGAIPDGTIGDR